MVSAAQITFLRITATKISPDVVSDAVLLDAMDALVVRDRLAARKVQTVGDGSIILLAFADVAVTGGEMGCQEAK